MVSPKHSLFVVETPLYFKALKKFMSTVPDDIYVNVSSITDILMEYLLSGESQEDLIKLSRLAIEAKDFNDEDYFMDLLRESSSELLQPLREMLQVKIPQVTKDFYTIEQVRAVKSTQTITLRLQRHETHLSAPECIARSGYGRTGKRNT